MTSRAGQGGFSNWQELRDHAIDLFNETPHPATEQEIIDAYELHPDAIAKAVDSIAVDVQNGTARSGWGVLRARAGSIKAPPSNPDRKSGLDKEKSIARAEQFIRATGVHLDRPDEVLDELFGDGGHLRHYAQVDLERTGPNDDNGLPTWKLSTVKGDQALATRMLDLWAEHRHVGFTIEREAEQRAEDWKARQRLMAESFGRIKDMLDEQQAPLPDVDYTANPETDPEPASVPA